MKQDAVTSLILRLTLFYALFAAAWIVLSDELLELFVDAERITRLGSAKGLTFVFVTSGLLLLALRHIAARSARELASAPGADHPALAGGAPLAPAPAYALALLTSAAMLVLRLAIDIPLVERPMMILFTLPIALSALFGGWSAGMLATLLAVLGQCMLVLGIEQTDDIGLRNLFLFQIAVLFGTGVAVSLASGALHRSTARLQHALARERVVRGEYRLLSDQLPDPVWRKDLAGRYVDCNLRFAEVLGAPRATIIGSTDGALQGVEGARFAAAETRVLATLAPLEFEAPWPGPATIGWVNVQLVPVHDAEGTCIGTLGIARDINRRHLAERALQEREALFRTLFDIGDDGVLIAELDVAGNVGCFTQCNTRALDMFALERVALLARPATELVDPASAPRLSELLSEAMVSGRAQSLLNGLRGDGQCFPLELVLIRFSLGELGGDAMMFVLRDVSVRVAAEQEQARLNEQVTQMQKLEAIGQLTGGIAHDFNNILATIVGNTELAQRRGAGALAGYLEQIAAAAGRGRDLVAKLMTFSRTRDAPHAAVSTVPHAAVAEAVALLRSALPTSIDIETRLARDTRPVRCDAIEIEQLVMNLAINARDAIEGSGHIVIELADTVLEERICTACRAPFAGEYVQLTVEDDGHGIGSADLSRVFQPFYSTKEVGRGTGLGLAVVHGIVHRAGGHVLIERPPGRGTRLRLCLPPHNDGGDGEQAAVPLETPLDHAGAGRHVVVVDDEPALARLLGELLELEGYRVSVFVDAREALGTIAAAPQAVDAVLTDLTMPGLTGDALAQAIAAHRADLPVLIMSGAGALNDDAGDLSTTVRARLRKPIDSAQLFDALARALT
ncbi:MAG: PAS domain-containing protein [Gammaproteobacteria bacterium]